MPDDKDVHTEHCCKDHGCKYSDDECSVANLTKEQSYLCEMCEEDLRDGRTINLTQEDSMVLLTMLDDLAKIEHEDHVGVLIRRGHHSAATFLAKMDWYNKKEWYDKIKQKGKS